MLSSGRILVGHNRAVGLLAERLLFRKEGRRTMKRAGLYARVSTNHGQDPETQLLALREYARARDLEITEEYVDVGISGSKEKRPALDQMMKDAHKRRFDVVLVARFDRFARSTRHLVLALEEFNALNVDFISVSESIDTSTPMGKMVFTVLSSYLASIISRTKGAKYEPFKICVHSFACFCDFGRCH